MKRFLALTAAVCLAAAGAWAQAVPAGSWSHAYLARVAMPYSSLFARLVPLDRFDPKAVAASRIEARGRRGRIIADLGRSRINQNGRPAVFLVASPVRVTDRFTWPGSVMRGRLTPAIVGH